MTMVECFYDKLLALDYLGADAMQKTKAHDTPNYNFINEYRLYPLFCKCFNCGQIISFHKLTPKHDDEQYNRDKIKNNILKFLSFDKHTPILKNIYIKKMLD